MDDTPNKKSSPLIEAGYRDGFGNWKTVSKTTRQAIEPVLQRGGSREDTTEILFQGESTNRAKPGRLKLEDGTIVVYDDWIPPDLPTGYHADQSDDGSAPKLLIVAPSTCYLPNDMRIWGWAVQAYALRGKDSWGIGDFASLERFAIFAAKHGAAMLQVNPVCAVTPNLPQTDSPYYPTSRRFLSPIYLDIDKVAETSLGIYDCGPLAVQARKLNNERMIDRTEVFRLKLQALEQIWEEAILDVPFKRFLVDCGDSLEQFATFSVLAEKHGSDYRQWPTEFRHPSSPEIERFRDENLKRVRFFEWLQWQADLQLSEVDDRIDLVCDLPIGFDPGGFDAWEWQDVVAQEMAIGAPPDAFNADGQNWGIPPLIPSLLSSVGFRPFIETIRANLKNAGGLRIDHVMGLYRLFWVPQGMSASDGAFVKYPKDILMAILCVESQRAGSWIAGEDLGTLPEGMQEDLERRDVLSHRLALFSDERPAEFPRKTLTAVTTHDLPTIAGLWTGSERASLKRLGLTCDDDELDGMVQSICQTAGVAERTPLGETIEKTYEALAESNSAVVVANLEDALLVEERPNVPGTTDEWPNWRLTLPNCVDEIVDAPLFLRISEILSRGRREKRSKTEA